MCPAAGHHAKSAATIDPGAGEILVDFTARRHRPRAASTSCSTTHAYSTFAIRSCLNPDLPNTGSLAPIKVHAPEGRSSTASILRRSTPVMVGMYVLMPILKAFIR
jgi:N-methylhydantoinase B